MDGLQEMFTVTILVIPTVILLGLVLALRKALARINELQELMKTYESSVEEAQSTNATFESWFFEFKERVLAAYQRIKIIDASGHFEADDEVGFFFKELKAVIERLHELGVIDAIDFDAAARPANAVITSQQLEKVLAERSTASSKGKEETR